MYRQIISTKHRSLWSLLVAGVVFLAFSGAAAAQECTGDCSGNGEVSVAEVITCVNIALGTKELVDCSACSAGDAVVITDLISAVDHSVNTNCPPPNTATSTPTSSVTSTATPTGTPVGTATATITPTSTFVDTATPTATPTNTPQDTATATPTAEDTATSSPTPTETPTPEDTATSTETPTGTPTRNIVIDPAFKIVFPDEVEANTVVAGDVAVDVGLPDDADAETLRVFLDGTEVPDFGMPSGTTGAEAGTVSGVIPDVEPGLHSVSAEVDVSRNGGAVAVTQQDVLVLEPTATVTPTASDTPTETNTPEGTATDTPQPTATDTPQPTDTPTATNTVEPTNTPTPTNTAEPTPTNTVSCPITAGNYTLTQVAGGSLTVDGLPAFPFPAGGVIKQTVGAGNADCVHETAVPFPGGFSAPTFCIPALSFSTSVVQTGCGIGRIDSDGGSDFTISEVGDTSAPNAPCFLPASCAAGANSNVRVDVTVGDGSADTCGVGTANATVSVPVFTTTWLSFAGCPDPDGTFNPPPGGADTLIVSFPQTLDFTTDTTTASWSDIDGPDCAIAGAGPAGGFGIIGGTCIDLSGVDTAGADVTTVASGTIGSRGAPLYDLTFVTVLPNELGTGSGDAATCEEPPLIDFAGTVTRCIP